MGEIRVNGNTVAVFENGTVYAGGSTWGIVIGYYGGGRIEDEFRKTVARYSAGTAYALDSFDSVWSSGSALCHCSGTTIYEGGNSWNNTLGSFTGDIDGACVAAALYFSLHQNQTTHIPEGNTVQAGEVGGTSSGSYAFWGGLIVTVLCLLMTYIFWFTDSGRKLLFGETEGMVTFGGCIIAAIIGSYKIYKQDNIKKWTDIIGTAAIWYFVALVITWIVCILSGIADNVISFWFCLGAILFAPIIVVGAAAPVFIIQVLLLILMKHKSSK